MPRHHDSYRLLVLCTAALLANPWAAGPPVARASEPSEVQPAEAPTRASPRVPVNELATSADDELDEESPGVVNINEATLEELTRLPGIGPRRAEAIIALRERLSGFKQLPQIMRVRGVGRKTFRKLRPMLTLQGPTTLKHKPRGK